MAFIRPEVLEAISRFRDAIIGVAVSLVGLYLALGNIGALSILGTSLAIAGALLVFAGIQRGRFRSGAGGSGMVLVDEGQVTYYGPHEGGSVVIADLASVVLDQASEPASQWVLREQGAVQLRIPTDAEGADALFDVFSSLDGMHTGEMLAALENTRAQVVEIWRANPAIVH
ncbi:MAG: hypothetical protein V3U96_02125 [Paracoccaceae bacterium]